MEEKPQPASPAALDLRGTSVDVSGLIDVLGHHLYSTPAVAIRELIQNAHDGIVRRRLEDPLWRGGKITVRCDSAKGVVTFEDDGAGLTESEIHSYLATIGAGYTKLLRSSSESEDLIGQFGLGFLSAFTLAMNVTVNTASHRDPMHAWTYASKGGERYTVAPAARRQPGTTVTIGLRPELIDFASTTVLRDLMSQYCALLPIPIRLHPAKTPINAETPPWREHVPGEHPTLHRRRLFEYVKKFEPRFEPLAVLPVEPGGGSDIHGTLWINGASSYASSDSRRLSVYVRGMLMDDNDRDLLPEWAGFMSGIIESNQMTPTAGRESLQRDSRWTAARILLERTVIDGLALVAREEPEAWRAVLRRHNESLLGASLCDPALFDLLADQLTVPTTSGDLTARAAVRSNDGRLYLAMPGENDFATTLFRALHIPVARGDRYAVVPFMHRYARTKSIPLVEVGTAEGNTALLRPAAIADEDLAWLQINIASSRESVHAARFEPSGLPLVVVPDREAELKKMIESDQADRRMAAGALHLARLYTARLDDRPLARLYINMGCRLIQRLLAVRESESESVREVARGLRGLKVLVSAPGQEVESLPDALSELAGALERLLP
jgi:molecular chaperone HtpG